MKRRFEIPMTPRLQRYADAWARSPKPAQIEPTLPGQESVWDYPRPPAVEEVDVRVQVFAGDRLIADAARCLRVLETASPPTIYLAREDVTMSALTLEQGSTFCEWKGAASYYLVPTPDGPRSRAAWSYEAPLAEYDMLRGQISFSPAQVTRCIYDGEVVRAQPGGFYGGWITDAIVGPFKGGPGSSGW